MSYSRINCTNSPASGVGNIASLGWRRKSGDCAKSCARRSVFLQSERWRCKYWSAYVVAVVTWLRWGDRKVGETLAEGCHAKRRVFCGCNPAILSQHKSAKIFVWNIQTCVNKKSSRLESCHSPCPTLYRTTIKHHWGLTVNSLRNTTGRHSL